MTYQQEQELLSAALDSFPATFELRDRVVAGVAFRVCRPKSYVNSAGEVQIVIQVRESFAGRAWTDVPAWSDYWRGTPSVLRAQILRPIHA